MDRIGSNLVSIFQGVRRTPDNASLTESIHRSYDVAEQWCAAMLSGYLQYWGLDKCSFILLMVRPPVCICSWLTFTCYALLCKWYVQTPASVCTVCIGLPVLKHVLIPRSKALRLCMEKLRNRLDAVYDVTIAYSNTRKESEGSVSRLNSPSLSCKYLLGRYCKHLSCCEKTYVCIIFTRA